MCLKFILIHLSILKHNHYSHFFSPDFVFYFIQSVTKTKTAEILQWFFLALPQYSLFQCAQSLASKKISNVYDWKLPGIGRHLTYMGVSGLVYFALVFIIEFRVFSKATQCFRGAFEGKLPIQPLAQGIDDDVIEEKKKVDAMSAQDLHVNNLVLRNLSKFYGKFLAVNQISVAVKRYNLQRISNAVPVQGTTSYRYTI